MYTFDRMSTYQLVTTFNISYIYSLVIEEECEDTKEVTRCRKSKDKQRSTKHSHKTKDRVTRTQLKTKDRVTRTQLKTKDRVTRT